MTKKQKKVLIRIIVAAILLVILHFVTGLLAKYKINLSTTNALESKEFYFFSNIASVDDNNVFSKSWDGVGSLNISFNIRNYENTLLYSPDDISYDVSVEKFNDSNNEIDVGIKKNGTDTFVTGRQTLTGNKISENSYVIEVKKSKNYKNLTELKLKLVLKSVSPYVKKIERELNVKIENPNTNIKLVNYSDYVELNINTNEITGNKNFVYDNSKLILDKSNTLLNDVVISTNNLVNSFSFPLSKCNKKINCKIIFIKRNSSENIVLNKDIIVN